MQVLATVLYTCSILSTVHNRDMYEYITTQTKVVLSHKFRVLEFHLVKLFFQILISITLTDELHSIGCSKGVELIIRNQLKPIVI